MTRAFRTSLLLAPLGFVLLTPIPSSAQFLPDGTYTVAPWTSKGNIGDQIHCLAIQTDSTGQQKILAAGYGGNDQGSNYQVGIARYWPDESFDTGYGTNGVTVTGPTNASAGAITLQSDNKAIVVGSNNYFLVLRYTTTGQLDPTFNGKGWVSQPLGTAGGGASGVALQSGKIVVTGTSNSAFAVARFTANGGLDTGATGFGQADRKGNRLGYRITSPVPGAGCGCQGMALQPDGKILAVGYTYAPTNSGGRALAIVRYTPDGDLDPTFNGSGVLTTFLGGSLAIGNRIAVDPGGNILVSGTWRSSSTPANMLLVARFLPGGALDPTFNHVGYVTSSIAGFGFNGGDIFPQNGQILVGGTLYSSTNAPVGVGVARLNGDGSPDAFFGNNGAKVLVPAGSTNAAGGVMGILAGGAIMGGGNYVNSAGRNIPMIYQFLP